MNNIITGKKMEPKMSTPEKKVKKRNRFKRGSGIITRIPSQIIPPESTKVDDDDPFENCDSDRWSLKMAIDHITKFKTKKMRIETIGYKGGPVTASTFDSFTNILVVTLFRLYWKLEAEVQNSLRIFYFGLEKQNLARFRNLTHSLHINNIFYRYPWLTTDETLRGPVKISEVVEKRRRSKCKDELKPFSEACKQYEIEKKKCLKIDIKTELDQIDNAVNQNLPNTSTNSNFNNIEAQKLNDRHLLISQEYDNMISAISQYNPGINERNETIKEEKNSIEETQTSLKRKKRFRRHGKWYNVIDNDNTEIPTQSKIIKNTVTPMMHFENRKTKLITLAPLSLGDLIVLVSFYYKLDCMEQQLLIEKMKVLEAAKPFQAAYLRQYVRTTCPLYDDNEIVFKPIPEELIISEVNMNLHDVTCIEDILEKDFCVSDTGLLEKCNKIENPASDCLYDNKHDSKEFDFGSAFL